MRNLKCSWVNALQTRLCTQQARLSSQSYAGSRIPRRYAFVPPFACLSLFGMQPTSERPSLWLALSVVTGLPIILWAYKSTMVYIFQRKIIYMGYAPPGARSQEIERDVPHRHLKDIQCEEISIQAPKNVSLSGILVRRSVPDGVEQQPPDTIIVYLQGNAGNPLHRLPVFQKLLRPNQFHHASTEVDTNRLAVVAAVPRSYWKSTPRSPTQKGLTKDYLQILKYTVTRFPEARIIIYGHSLGGAVAVCLLSQIQEHTQNVKKQTKCSNFNADARFANIRGLILENPFSSIPDMTKALYPERWTPYHYMGPLTWDKWDAISAMGEAKENASVLGRLSKGMMILVSEKDEMVPNEMGRALWLAGEDGEASSNEVEHGHPGRSGGIVVIRDALHENAWERRQWLKEMTRYIAEIRQ